jgi:glutamate racemase
MVPADVAIIDTGAAVARQLQRLLGATICWPKARPATRFWTSADPEIPRKSYRAVA